MFSNILRVRVARDITKMSSQLLLPVVAAEFSSMLQKSQRAKLLKKFKNRQINVIVSSDAMARGMDFPFVDYVFNFQPPAFAKTFVSFRVFFI